MEREQRQQKSWDSVISQSIEEDLYNPERWISSTLERLEVVGEGVLPQHQARYAKASSHSSRLFKDIRAIEQQGRHVDLREVAKLSDLTHSAAQTSYEAAKSQLYAAGMKGLMFAGRVSTIYDYGNSVYTVMQADESQRVRVAFEQAGEQLVGSGTILVVNAVTAALSVGSVGASLAISIPLSVSLSAATRPLGTMGGDWAYERYEDFSKGYKEMPNWFKKWN